MDFLRRMLRQLICRHQFKLEEVSSIHQRMVSYGSMISIPQQINDKLITQNFTCVHCSKHFVKYRWESEN